LSLLGGGLADLAIDGECDFVVAHAEMGMLMLEVKGGAVVRPKGPSRRPPIEAFRQPA
jgi:hypothetical protein